MTLHSERPMPPVTKENSSERQDTARANEGASPKPEHNDDNSTFTETLSRANESEPRETPRNFIENLKHLISRPWIKRTLAITAIAGVTYGSGIVKFGDSEESTQEPHSAAISALATPPPSAIETPPTTKMTSLIEQGPPTFKEGDPKLKNVEKFTIEPDAYVELPPVGLTPKTTSDYFFSKTLNKVANSKDENGQWRPELVDNLFTGNCEGLEYVRTSVSNLQQEYDRLLSNNRLPEGSFITFTHTTQSTEKSTLYVGADMNKEKAIGYIVTPEGYIVYMGYPLDGQYIFDPQKHTTSSYPDGSEKKGMVLQNVWSPGKELPN